MTAQHCPGCKGYTPDWQHVCGGLPVAVPGGVRELIAAEIAAYEYDRELTNPGSLDGRIAEALARAHLLAESAEPMPEVPS